MTVNPATQISKQFRDTYFGGNWTAVNFRDTLADLTWQEVVTQVDSLNSIAKLVYHTNYYIIAVLKVLRGERLDAQDKYSFDLPPIQSQDDWEKLLEKTWDYARQIADLVEQLPESRLWENLADEKYGTYYRNLHGIIEHSHYHLGQIVLIKKMIRENRDPEKN